MSCLNWSRHRQQPRHPHHHHHHSLAGLQLKRARLGNQAASLGINKSQLISAVSNTTDLSYLKLFTYLCLLSPRPLCPSTATSEESCFNLVYSMSKVWRLMLSRVLLLDTNWSRRDQSDRSGYNPPGLTSGIALWTARRRHCTLIFAHSTFPKFVSLISSQACLRCSLRLLKKERLGRDKRKVTGWRQNVTINTQRERC